MISIVQNYICTNQKRLEFVQSSFPSWQKQFSNYKFYVNYNHTENFNIIKNLYEKYIPDYEIYNDLEKDWGKTTLSLINRVNTKYTLFLIEDFVAVNDDISYFEKVLKEASENNCNYILMHKIKKYTHSSLLKIYEERKNIYICDWDKYPASCLSIVAVFETNVIKTILNHYIKQNRDRKTHGIHTPNNFEDFYSNWNNNFMKNELPMFMFDNGIYMKASIPKHEILMETEGAKVTKQREILPGRIN